MSIDPRQFLNDLYATAVEAVSAQKCMPAYLPKQSAKGRTLVIGAGKGAAAMAKVVEDTWPGKVCLLYTSPSPRDRQKSRMPSSA